MNSSLNIPSREFSLIEYHSSRNENVNYDIYKEETIFQKISKCSDDKFNKNAITDKDKTDMSNINDSKSTSKNHKGSKDATKRTKKITQIKIKFYTW